MSIWFSLKKVRVSGAYFGDDPVPIMIFKGLQVYARVGMSMAYIAGMVRCIIEQLTGYI